MKNFNYSVIITTEDNRFTYETNDVREAIRAVFECGEDDAHICLCNGYTGEVLYHNGDEPWCTDEMSLMMLGFVVEQASAEEEEDEEDEEDIMEDEYEIETDESYILELEERVTHLAEKVVALEKENNALRRMLQDTDAIRQYLRG